MSVNHGNSSFGIVMAMAAGIIGYQKLVVGPPRDVVAAAIQTLRSDASDEERLKASRSLSRHPDLAYDAIYAEIDEECAVSWSGPTEDDSSYPRLVTLMEMLARLTDERALLDVRAVATRHDDPRVRRAAVAALARIQDVGAMVPLRRIVERDPCLLVRQQALIAIAELGDDSVLDELVDLLHPATVADVRESANRLLESFTDHDFKRDLDQAKAWLTREDCITSTDVDGVPPGPATTVVDLEFEGGSVVMGASDVRFVVERRDSQAMQLVVRAESGVILIELALDGEQPPMARTRDLPKFGLGLERHAPILVTQSDDAYSINLPRVGVFDAGEPFEVSVIRTPRS